MGPLGRPATRRGPVLLGGRPEPIVDRSDLAFPVDTRNLIDGLRTIAAGGVPEIDPGKIVCPPATYRTTGVAPHQAPGVTAISHQPRDQIRPGQVAVSPSDFGAPGQRRANWPAFLGTRIFLDWDHAQTPPGAPQIPASLPSHGPYQPVDVISPPPPRLGQTGNIDVYGYPSKGAAWTSTRIVPGVAHIPRNRVGVICP